MTSETHGVAGAPWPEGLVLDGRYEVREMVGAGAHGVVYQAKHLQWNVDLALKRPDPAAMSDAAQRKRFIDEAEAWVSLGLHPNICSCHYVRVLASTPTVFAEYVAGGSLGNWIETRQLYADLTATAATLRVLDVAIQCAWGLNHAHSRGLVHRDVKPANLLVQPEPSGSGLTIKVTDFGLARAFPGSTLLPTNSRRAVPGDAGSLVSTATGTNHYASPEQGRGEPLTVRTDVYSLAVSVLEMFTGERTWRTGDQAGNALDDYLHEGPAEVGLPPMPPPVATLLRECLGADPAHRPGSMAEIANELTDIYADITGSAYPRPRPTDADLRADEFNNRALSLRDLGKLTEADNAFAEALRIDPRHVFATYNFGLIRWRRGALTDEDLIANLESISTDTGYTAEIRLLLAHVQEERGNRAKATEVSDTSDTSDSLIVVLPTPWKNAPNPQVFGLPPFPNGQRPLDSAERAIRISRDASKTLIGCIDGSILLWQGDTEQRVRGVMQLKGHNAPGHDIQLTPDGKHALTGAFDRTVRLWDLDSGRCLRTFRAGRRERGRVLVGISADARIGVWTDADNRVQVWDLLTGRHLHTLSRPDEYLVTLALSPDGQTLLVSHAYGTDTEVWDTRAGRLLRRLTIDKPFAMTALCFSDDGTLAATAGTLVPTIRIWDVHTGRCRQTLSGHEKAIDNLAFSPDARFLLSGSQDETVRYWEVRTGRCVRTFRGHVGEVCDVRFASYPGLPNRGEIGLSVGKDHDVRIWRLPDSYAAPAQLCKPRHINELDGAAREALALTEQAERALAADDRRQTLDLLTLARQIPGHERAQRALKAWDELARRTSRTGLRAIWPMGKLAVGEMSHLAVSRNGNVAATLTDSRHDVLSQDREILLWDLETRRIIAAHRVAGGTDSMVRGIAPSPDGGQVLYVVDERRDLDDYGHGRRSRLNLWRPGIGAMASQTLDIGVRALQHYGEAGQRLLIGGYDGSVRVWDVQAWCEVAALKAHTKEVVDLAVARNGGIAVSGAWDGTARIWDLERAVCLHVLPHSAYVMAVDISADARLVISSGAREDPTIRVWDARNGAFVREFEPFAGWATTLRFTQDAAFAVSAGTDGRLRVWDVNTGRRIREIEAHREFVGGFGITDDARMMISAGGLFEPDAILWKLDWELTVTPETAQHPSQQIPSTPRLDLASREPAGPSGAVQRTAQPTPSGSRVDLATAEAIADTGRNFPWTWEHLDANRFCAHMNWPEPEPYRGLGVETITLAQVNSPTATFTHWGQHIGMISIKVTDTIENTEPGTSDFIANAFTALTDKLTALLGAPGQMRQIHGQLEATWRVTPTLMIQISTVKTSCFIRMINIGYYRFWEEARTLSP
ncbi:DUF6301 family protein [Nonomuraea sp. NPDC003707]